MDPAKCTGCGTCLTACPIRYEVQHPPEAERLARSAYASATEELVVGGINAKHRDEPGNLLPILLDINRQFNWLPRASLEHVAGELKIPLAEILRVASFYNAFSLVPRGRHIVSFCLGTGCFVKGSPLGFNYYKADLQNMYNMANLGVQEQYGMGQLGNQYMNSYANMLKVMGIMEGMPMYTNPWGAAMGGAMAMWPFS